MNSAVNVPAYSSNKAGLYLIPVCTLGAAALMLVVARIYTHLARTAKLYLDDWLIIAAEILSIVDTAIAIAAVAHGWGKPIYMFTPEALVQTLRLQFALQVVWIVTLCLVRVSVACSLLRFGTGNLWRMPLYFIIGLQILISSSYIVIQFGQCTPVSANWQTIPDVKCWDITPIVNYGWAVAAIYVIMDLVLSLMPIQLIRTLHRGTTEKVLICVLMSLGLLATAVACAKMTTFNDFGKGDVMQATIKPSMLARLEEIVGIIACSLTCLKGPVERALRKMGLVKQHDPTTPSFVNAVSLPGFGEQRDDSGYGISGKGSVAGVHGDVTPGSSTHDIASQGQVGDTSQAV